MPWVYCLRVGSEDCFKVGRTKDSVSRRKVQVAVGSSRNLTIYREIVTDYPNELENYIHKLLDLTRAENGEWFNISAEGLDAAFDEGESFIHMAMPQNARAEELQAAKPDEQIVEPSDADSAVYQDLRRARREMFLLKKRVELLETQLKIAIGAHLGLRGIAKWFWRETPRFDNTRFREEQPEMYAEYTKFQATRVFDLEGP
jgi:hypothetical protein